MRPADHNFLWGNYAKARNKFDWKPETQFENWVQIMVENDIKHLSS